ncbi:MAG: hypothetical protein H5T64_03010 [Chloroflexi bacterium]|nr:hypothetical protein [Chloroflexota bacterium]
MAVSVEDMLSEHADALNCGQLYEPQGTETVAILSPLIDLAIRVKWVLAPARPSPQFREQLRANLMQMAGHAELQPVLMHQAPRYQRGLLIGAAAVFAGSVAYLLRSRIAGRAH